MPPPFCPTPPEVGGGGEAFTGSGGCDQCVDKGPCFSIGAQYILWWARAQSYPPLVTSGDMLDSVPGALGQPHTTVLLDGSDTSNTQHSGGRITVGYGVERCDCCLSVDGSFFALAQRGTSHGFASDGSGNSVALSRPFFNVVANAEDADPVALPFVSSGQIRVDLSSRLYGGDANLRWLLWNSELVGQRAVLLFGGRFLALDEGLSISEIGQDLSGQGVPGNSFRANESFSTRNRFSGGQIGGEYQWRHGPFSLTATGKVALGDTEETITNKAFIAITEPSGLTTTSTDRALYIGPGNAGSFSRSHFAVAPEGDVQLGIDFNEYVRLTVGYTYVYISQVARPGSQIDRNVNVQPVGTPAAFLPPPGTPVIQSTHFWAQGLDVGLRLSF
jgi:hypothetical protein